MLVCCYTNHALDQFLEDLLKQGVPQSRIVRLGSKPSPATQCMALSTHAAVYRFGDSDWEVINSMKDSLERQGGELQGAFSSFVGKLGPQALFKHLELTNPTYFDALSVPPADNDMILIGESGRAVDSTYLLSRFLSGRDPGVLREHPNIAASRNLWDLPLEARKMLLARWGEEMLEAQVDPILEAGDKYNNLQTPISDKFQERTGRVLENKQIIACTTTGAAIYRDAIRRAGPQILVVEEAGEVQESHVLTALSQHTERMILIGDHKYVIALLPFPCLIR